MHWIIVPVVLPALLAPVIGFVMRHDITLARAASVAGTLALVAVALGLTAAAADGTPQVYRLGDWPAPFGIVLVLDRLSAVMVLLTSVLALIVLIHAIATGWDDRGRHFHALFQFQLMGVCGAFLTGDVFNLFVFFEVLLIASYGLMIHSGGRARMRAGLQYVVMNLAGSTLFLFALGTLYASTGTLNIADMALRIAEIPQRRAALVQRVFAAFVLMIVFRGQGGAVPGAVLACPATLCPIARPRWRRGFRDHDQRSGAIADPAGPLPSPRTGDRGTENLAATWAVSRRDRDHPPGGLPPVLGRAPADAAGRLFGDRASSGHEW